MNRINYFLGIVLLVGLALTGCKKDEKGTVSSADVAVSTDSESEDALAENTDQSVDNALDALEANDFSGLKSATPTGLTVSVDHPDTTYFPKIVTLTFNLDTVINDIKVSQYGTISIKVELTKANGKPWKNYIKRTITFSSSDPFTISTDSSSLSITGTRVMTRKSIKATVTADLKKASVSVLDTINSDLSFKITCGNYSGTFTRIMKRSRLGIVHFERLGIFMRQTYLKDTLAYQGSVTGVNLLGEDYSRVITTPVTFTVCPYYYPVISKGTIELTNGTGKATVSYAADVCRTKVTLTVDGNSKSIDRKLNKKFSKWW